MTPFYPSQDHLPTTGDVGAIFADEILAHGGVLVDQVDDGERLFGRALLAVSSDVAPGDAVVGGIAVHVQGPYVRVHGYTHRQVCSNGAMAVAPGEVFRVERAPAATLPELVAPVHEAIRAAVRQCADSPAFFQAIVRMRLATRLEAHRAMYVVPQLLLAMATLAPPGWHDRTLHEVMKRFQHSADQSLYGLFNAVTSTARDEPDPALRWELEVVGGQVLELATVRRPPSVGRSWRQQSEVARQVGELVEAGASGT